MLKYKPTFLFILFLVSGWLVLQTSTVQADDVVVKLTLHPSPLPVPAMKYRLMTPPNDLKLGNAANYYQRALMGTGNANNVYKHYSRQIDFLNKDLKTVGDPENDSLFKNLAESATFFELDRASVCNHCDWEIPYDQFGYSTLLYDIQEMKSLTRAIASYVRLLIAKGKYEEAIIASRKAVMLCHNLRNGSVGIISNLVGFHCFDIIRKQLQELMSLPDSPNLYWALSEVSHQQLQYHHSIELENSYLLKYIPSISKIEDHVFNKEEEKRLRKELLSLSRFEEKIEHTEDVVYAEMALWSLSAYSHSRKVLEEKGYSKDKIESMPTIQVVVLGEYLKLHEFRHEIIKCFLLKPEKGLILINQVEKKRMRYFSSIASSKFSFHQYESAITNLLVFSTKFQQKINLLRTIELIRDYISRNQKFPSSLDQLDPLLLPMNPATGKPLHYQLNGKKAVLSAAVKNSYPNYRFELQLAE